MSRLKFWIRSLSSKQIAYGTLGLAALPAIAQLVLLAIAIAGRWLYPYDLEWMEGGMLHHAQRIADGDGIYVAPSVEFIPFLYTPLYPALLAGMSPIFGISYATARGVSIASTIALCYLAYRSVKPRGPTTNPNLARIGALISIGFFAAAYPYYDGWYDLARGDTLFLAMASAGILGVMSWSRASTGWRGHGLVAIAGAILALSFFCKQTGIFFVAAGGVVVLLRNWRRVPVYVATTGIIGLGGTYLLQQTSGGWFWTYAFEVHQTHDCNPDRFWASFGHILWKYPPITIVVAITLIVAIIARLLPPTNDAEIVDHEGAAHVAAPSHTQRFLLWTGMYAWCTLLGAIGWATMWAHFNAYMPALFCGGLAAGCALPVLHTHGRRLTERWFPRKAALAASTTTTVACVALSSQLLVSWWDPGRFIPTPDDEARGDALIARLRKVDGDILMPFHPWYAHLAGKPVFVHRIGVYDVSYKPPPRTSKKPQCFFHDSHGRANWAIPDLAKSLRQHRFAHIIWDRRAIAGRDRQYFPGLSDSYKPSALLPRAQRPRTYTGAKTSPTVVLTPARTEPPPPGARVLFDFEERSYPRGWQRQGRAWGTRPVRRPTRGQGVVVGYSGRGFATSMHGGDSSTGSLTSPVFTLDGSSLSFLLSGGNASGLEVSLLVAGEPVKRVQPARSSEVMQTVVIDVTPWRGQKARLRLSDQAKTGWGHLNVDRFVLHP